MADQIKIYYSKLRNMGDCLNELILEKCFGYQAERCSFLDGELCGIGSCLGQYTLHGTKAMRLQQRINGVKNPHVYIWGTGFINYSDAEGTFFKKNMEFCAVRGELTKKNVERMTGKKLDVPMADAGILASELLDEMPQKRYEVGIVPHLCDLKDPKVKELMETYPGSKFINVKDDPQQVVKEIAECRYILSSSLHGLIVADSFHIPNMYLVFGDRLLGDGYKFDDYYSAYGITQPPRDLRTEAVPELSEIEKEYQILPEMVEEKKRQMREAFPFPSHKQTEYKEDKLISVVIPTYNRKEKLPECIKSVLSQSYRNIEVLVVDDASTDGTQELFQTITDPRLHYLRYDTNRGACYARNYGAKRAKGELIAFQDSDDTWHVDKLRKQYQYLCEHKVDLCFCGMNRIAENGSSFHFPVHGFHPEHALADFLAENRASTQTMLMWKPIWEHVKFDEEIRRYQDWDFGIRAAKDFTLGYLPEALVDSEVGADSISSRVKSYPHLLHLYQKHEALYEMYPQSKAIMNRRLGKRVHTTEPAVAAAHFKKSYQISRNFYDWSYWMTDRLRSCMSRSERKVSR